MSSLVRRLSRLTSARLLSNKTNTHAVKKAVICSTPSVCQRASEDFPSFQKVGLPVVTSRKLEKLNPFVEPKQAWLENIDTVNSEKLGIIDLHPDIFSTPPRIDILHKNVKWQQKYREIDWRRSITKSEIDRSGRKPWKQKKTGKHRAGNSLAPQWRHGGVANGPRGPKSDFYMLSYSERELGLRIALSVKYAQNDLHIVNTLDIPTDEPDFLQELVDTRYWGFSALFVDDTDIMPVNFALASCEFGQFNYLPVYGLNVYSILKHESLVLTIAAVEKIEKMLLDQMYSPFQNKKV